MGDKGDVPQDFKDAVIINLEKNNSSVSDCYNYSGIFLLPVSSKILTEKKHSQPDFHTPSIRGKGP